MKRRVGTQRAVHLSRMDDAYPRELLAPSLKYPLTHATLSHHIAWSEGAMYCITCRQSGVETANFCTVCGTKVH